MRRVCLLGLALTAACSDALEQTSSAGQVIGVVNAADNTVSFVSATDFSVRTVGLATPGGAATTAAGRGGTVIVPLGPADSVAVIHNAGLCTPACAFGPWWSSRCPGDQGLRALRFGTTRSPGWRTRTSTRSRG